jgi:hypothetical protein
VPERSSPDCSRTAVESGLRDFRSKLRRWPTAPPP